MIKYFSVLVLSYALWLSPAAASSSELPDWLAQVAAQKRQQPEAMLALLQQHQADIANLPLQQQANWYYQQAELFNVLARHQDQQQAAEQGLKILGDQQSVLKVQLWYQLGFAFEMQTNYQAAQQYYQQGISLATLLDDEVQVLYGQVNLAATFNNQNQEQRALALLQATYQQAQRLNDVPLLAEVNAELGLLYASLAYDNEAIDLLNKGLELFEQLGWHAKQITVLFNLARTYGYQGQHQQALNTYNKMLQKCLQINDSVNLYHAYLGLAITSSNMGSSEAALAYVDKAEQYLALQQSTAHVFTHHYEKALILNTLKQTSLALQQVMLAEQNMTAEGVAEDSPARLNVWYLKAELLAQQGEYQQAYQQLIPYISVVKSVQNHESDLALQQLKTEFDIEHQLEKKRLLQQENEQQAKQLTQVERSSQLQLIWLAILSCSCVILMLLLLWQIRISKTKNTAISDNAPRQTG